jgi:L-alanine-DL-glutamate epimerase-like enolase superfamily enzyme
MALRVSEKLRPFPKWAAKIVQPVSPPRRNWLSTMIGQSAADYESLADRLYEQAPLQPAARCGLETALLDAYCRAQSIPLWKLWGTADIRERETDITIPICSPDKTLELARGWYTRGFRLFKMKVGTDVELDIRRLQAVHDALPDIGFIGDGNQGFSREDCLRFVQRGEAVRRAAGLARTTGRAR